MTTTAFTVTFSQVATILQNTCGVVGCHRDDTHISTLNMNPPTYAELTSEPSLFNGQPRVIPGDQTDQSLLLRKARGELTHGGGTVWLTSNPDYITVRTWIREGSPNNLTFMRGH